MASKKSGYLGVAFYHPEIGREKEFMKLWLEGPSQIAQEMGASKISIYFRPETNDYMVTAHWDSVDSYLKFFNSSKVRPFYDRINDICREPAIHESFRIVEERAA